MLFTPVPTQELLTILGKKGILSVETGDPDLESTSTPLDNTTALASFIEWILQDSDHSSFYPDMMAWYVSHGEHYSYYYLVGFTLGERSLIVSMYNKMK